jgi:PKD repeat protein
MKKWSVQLFPIHVCTFFLLLAAMSHLAAADTYYIRIDGGSVSQCTGQADQPYPGSGSNQNCAWNHPFVALPPGGPARIQGGDTLHIQSGSYMMGYGAPAASNCHQSWSWECHMTRIPSGPSPDQPTRILGQGHDQGCPQAPELWGSERSWMVVNLEGSSNVELACLEVTDRDSCIESHCHNGQCSGEIAACNRNSPPFGPWASTGLSARDSENVTLRDVNIHGLANRGVFAGRLSDWALQRVRINANGWSGWDGDLGGNSSNSGELRFTEVEIGFNGCGERWPDGEIFGCWGQGGGGYGDGLGVAESGGHWIFEDSTIHHNTSDGIDLLYLVDGGQVTIRRTLVEANAGNQIKVSRQALIENSVVVGLCSWFTDFANMHPGDHCRAMGDTIFVGLSNGAQTDLINNSIVGQGNCVISGGGGTSDSRLRMANNLLLGNPYWHDPAKPSCLYYSGSDESVEWTNNYIDGVRHNACPGNSLCQGSPMIVESSLAGFDAQPLGGSPLIDAANIELAPLQDYYNHSRETDGSPDIGAIEWGAGPAPTVGPEARFSFSCTDLACEFDGSASSGDSIGFAWTLGDGSQASTSRVSHGYSVAGSYTVTLTVIDADGNSASSSQTVAVTAPVHSDGPTITLAVLGDRERGRWSADLYWSGSDAQAIEIYRDGVMLETVPNSGYYQDQTIPKGTNTAAYQVCAQQTAGCSERVMAYF